MTAATKTANGKPPEAEEQPPVPDPTFPVESFKDAAMQLRRPFTAAAVKFKVQATWGRDDKGGKTGALIVSYIDARLVVERLNLVCPHLWHDAYEPQPNGGLLCRLTVDGISRIDIGEGYQGKGLYSDALKRAAVKFGVGVSLYATPQIFLNLSDGHVKQKQVNNKPSLILTPAGESRCRELYSAWLSNLGSQAFGNPLDHGDAVYAVGDHEAEPEPEVDPEPAVETPPVEAEPQISKALAEDLFEGAKTAGLSGQKVSMWLTSNGVDHEEITTKASAVKALRLLSDELAAKFSEEIVGALNAADAEAQS